MKISFIALFLSLNTMLCGVQFVAVEAYAIPTVTLSCNTQNRLLIEGDRVKKVYFNNTDIIAEVEEISGQIFIQTLRPFPCHSNLSVISDSGFVQDLQLNFIDCSGEIIVLQELEEVDCPDPSSESCFDGEIIKSVVKGYLKGILPDGYVSIEDNEPPFDAVDYITMEKLFRLIGKDQIVFVYKIRNTSKKAKYISEGLLNVLDGDWVFVDKSYLNPCECAFVLIGCMR